MTANTVGTGPTVSFFPNRLGVSDHHDLPHPRWCEPSFSKDAWLRRRGEMSTNAAGPMVEREAERDFVLLGRVVPAESQQLFLHGLEGRFVCSCFQVAD